MQKLSKGSDQPAHFELVARWRFACGDAEAGASWQFWSLSPPPIDELRQALAVVWSSFGDFDQAEELLSDAPSWQQLALLLKQTRYDAAEQLQSRLLADPPFVTIPEILAIAADWQQAERPQRSLVLFEQLIAYMERRGEQPSSQFANALAAQLEQLERFIEAAPWWRRSLQLDPNQIWPLMRLAHHQMRCGQPAIAEHYCRAVLSLDANHQWAPGLQQQALEAMGARGSLALLKQYAIPS
ncbi:MAG: tetratricopeptide repeat protein, partial [Prochlorococcus sp.]